MAKKKAELNSGTPKSVTRRGFLKGGAAAGVGGAAALAGLGATTAKAEVTWNHEVDVVVIGAGAAGLPAAIAARDLGASVMVVEANFDTGGRAIVSGGGTYLGGGTSLQAAAGVKDSPDANFADWTRANHPKTRYNDRELARKYCDSCVATFDFLVKNGVVWDRLVPPDRMDSVQRRNSPREWPNPKEVISPGARGSGVMRPLQVSARQKGVQILLNHRMTTIYRESPNSGRVLGITAMEVDNWYQPKYRTVNIRAKKAVIIATGGSSTNVNFRRMFDPRLTEEYQVRAGSWTEKHADGELAAIAIGAALWGTAIQTDEQDDQIERGNPIGKRYDDSPTIPPDSPNFFRERAIGLFVADWQDAILVKENGRRFYDETISVAIGAKHEDLRAKRHGFCNAAMDWTGDPAKLNGGGPIWAIFDAAAVTREKWQVKPPYVDPAGYFVQGETLEELAGRIHLVSPYQWRPMPGTALRQTVERYNSFVDTGKDIDFGKPTPMFKIQKPPFYAAWATPVLHDTYAGLRINTNAQVMDMKGEIIPGLYAAGDSAGGFSMHGIGRATVFGRIAGMHAANLKPGTQTE